MILFSVHIIYKRAKTVAPGGDGGSRIHARGSSRPIGIETYGAFPGDLRCSAAEPACPVTFPSYLSWSSSQHLTKSVPHWNQHILLVSWKGKHRLSLILQWGQQPRWDESILNWLCGWCSHLLLHSRHYLVFPLIPFHAISLNSASIFGPLL